MDIKGMMVSRYIPCQLTLQLAGLQHINMCTSEQVLYGTTENSPITFCGFPEDNEELKINTVGCIMAHTEVFILFFLHTPQQVKPCNTS